MLHAILFALIKVKEQLMSLSQLDIQDKPFACKVPKKINFFLTYEIYLTSFNVHMSPLL